MRNISSRQNDAFDARQREALHLTSALAGCVGPAKLVKSINGQSSTDLTSVQLGVNADPTTAWFTVNWVDRKSQ
jgi:hypothetical protein